MTSLTTRALAASLFALALPAGAAECIVPAKPGGGMDLTCKLAAAGLQAMPRGEKSVLHVSYLPGGVGAVAWNSVQSRRKPYHDTLVAFSGGSLLNLAQGKYGDAGYKDVRWVAAIGADYGMIAVRADSPFKTLREFMDGLAHTPHRMVIGASGTAGSQDWMKVSALARQAGIARRSLRFVAFEGGGDAATALLAGYVQVISGDASEAAALAAAGKIRILAVFSEERLTGALSGVPTAREQGYDLVWPTIRGFYMGPHVSEAEYRAWVAELGKMMAQPAFQTLRAAHGLFPFSLTGDALTSYVDKTITEYSRQAAELRR